MTDTQSHKIEVKEAKPRSLDGSLSHKEEQQLAKEPLRLQSPSVFYPKKPHRRRCLCCCLSCVGAVVILAVIILVLALTVFKSKDPKIAVNGVTIDGLSTRVDTAKLTVHVNLTLIADMSLKNPNKAASFKHGDSTTVILYSGKTVGQAVIPAGEIKADKTVRMNITLTVFVDAVASSTSDLIADGIAGSIGMTTKTEMAGRVNLLRIIKKHVTVFASCDITVNLSNSTVNMQHCSNSFKL